jgi:hypothetical protein
VHKFWIDQLFILPVLWVLPLQRLRLAFVVFFSSRFFFFFFFLALTDLLRFKRVLDSFTTISINCPSRTSICVRVLAVRICNFTYFLLSVNTSDNLFVIYLANESFELSVHINFYEDQNKVISKHSK